MSTKESTLHSNSCKLEEVRYQISEAQYHLEAYFNHLQLAEDHYQRHLHHRFLAEEVDQGGV